MPQVLTLKDKPLPEIAEQVNSWKPNLVYFTHGAIGMKDTASPGTQPWPREADGESVCMHKQTYELVRA